MNNENNINGIPNVNDVKIEDTPAESFANLYGNGNQQPAQPVQPQPVPNPQVAQPVPPVQPTPQPVPPMPAQPVQPTPQVAQPMPAQPTQPAPQVAQPVPPVQPQQVPNPQVAQPVPPVQPQAMPNLQVVEPIQPVQVDADRLQSIEEQLSKTSQYKPEDFQQEKIDIPTTNQYEKNKSGISFVIVLFIILVLAIVALPFITKFFS